MARWPTTADLDGVTVLRDAPEAPDALAVVVAEAVRDLVDDRDALTPAGWQVQEQRRAGSREAVAEQFCATWAGLLEGAR